jgi:hypothetical protein
MVNAARFTGLVAVALAMTAGHASARITGVQVAQMPGHVVQGTTARVSVIVRPGGVTCNLRVRYAGGAVQGPTNRVEAARGLSSWSWTWSWSVPTTVQAGSAQVDVHCGRAGSLTRRFVVVGKLAAPRIAVLKSGFSTRQSESGSTRLSYGLILHNTAETKDADDLTVQTNFVLANDHLLGTDTQRVSGIAAGADFALGNTVYFPGAAPIVRLEVVVQAGGFVPRAIHVPTLENIHLVPQLFQPAWLGTIEGEIQNTDPAQTLQLARLSAVVLDGNGNIVGGTTGFVSQTLPPGARAFLQMSSLDVIPVDKAASADISITPTWQPVG